ncbi:dienelactone hydrolase family protein [Flavobacterium sp.]|uniref:dienelactone hydrolase family protein n=1 Tax=Flavobacterium sp. TaxID=239 RepID=UPI004034DB89
MKIKLLVLAMIMAANANAQLKAVAYKEGTQKLNGFAGVPKKPLRQKPGILILPAWMGINVHTKEVAAKLNALGYYTFVADIYGEGNAPSSPQQAGEKSGYFKSDPELYQKRIKAALDALIASGADKNNIVVIGYCFGGTGALEAARGGLNVKGVVSFHGGLGKDASRVNGSIATKVLVLHGADDPYVPQKDIEAFQKEMKDAKADWQMVYYANAVHAFTEKEAGNDNSKGAAYNEKADKRSWEHFIVFLEEIFSK